MAEEGASSRRRWLFGSTERQRDVSLSLSLTLTVQWNGTERDGTARDERGKVARNASATVRSPVPDEQIREYGRWKYRFRLEATADVLLILPPSFALYISLSFTLSSYARMFSVYTARSSCTRARAFSSLDV